MRTAFPLLVGVCLAISAGKLAHAQDRDATSRPSEPANRTRSGDNSNSQSSPLPATIIPTDYLLLPAVGEYGRLLLHRDAVEAQLAAGRWRVPADGDTVEGLDGKQKSWRAAQADGDGTLDTRTVRGGWAVTSFDSPAERVMLLEASGHAMVYVNGEPHAGDPYDLGWLRLPVRVREGRNVLLFHAAGDKLSARLTAPPAGVFFLDADHTLPTLVRDDAEPAWAAVPIVNATTDWLEHVAVVCQREERQPMETLVAPIPPLSVRKVPFQLPAADYREPANRISFHVRLQRVGGAHDPANAADAERSSRQPLAEFDVELGVVGPEDVHVRTFRSRIDGSVQPYAVRPAAKSVDLVVPGTILTLHGAAVTCADHAAQYEARSWAHVVAPQGRRPYGFDWETWGRIDALEALADARRHYPSDARRTYLTGHSMGGHGVWHLGVTCPDQFAAIGPSAGWISFWSYGGGMPSIEQPSDIEALLLRGYATSDTLKLLSNLSPTGVYVLHGGADENVPVEQARYMRTRLAQFHPNFAYYEQPGAGHWWGKECCDWPRMMDFFQRLSQPEPAEHELVNFTTANPGDSSRCHWVSIEAQQKQLEPSQVSIRQNAAARRFMGSTSNVARLALDVAHLAPNQPIDVVLDGQLLNWLNWSGDTRTLRFERRGDQWAAVAEISPQFKGPDRYGTFNAVFNHNALLVYGTLGTDEENQCAAAKARYDAETFWYRGGGTLEVIPDSRFDLNRDTDRSIVLYGNQDTNSAWPKLLATSPVEVKRGQVRVADRKEEGDSFAVVMARPRPGSDTALVGVVAGTGPPGMRLTNRLRWFVSGIVYPDLIILGPNVLSTGAADVRAGGYFGIDWQLDSGEIAWREATL
jgi:dienelactone hydrolase